MIRNYIISALRHLLKNRKFTVINIAGLAIGMAVAMLILNFVNFEFGYDKMHEKHKRIYRAESKFFEGTTLTDDWPTSSFGYGTAMKKNISGIEDIARVSVNQCERTVSYKDIKFRENGVTTTEPSFFNLFSFNLIGGDRQSALAGPNKVVITKSAGDRYFRGEDPIGKILTFKTSGNTIKCEVSGIMEDIPANSHFNFDFFISWETLPKWKRDFWYMHEVYTYVLLEPGVNPGSVESAFLQMAEQYKTREALKNKIWGISLNPLTDIHLTPQKQYEREVKGNRKAVNGFILVALAILIIAWFNYINLTITSSLERSREVGIRKASGATNKQVIFQFLTESLLVNGLALFIAFAIMLVSMPVFNNFTGKHVGFSLLTDSAFWIPLLVVFGLGILVSGFYPAFALSSVKPIAALRGKSKTTSGGASVRRILVVVQFAASFILICGTIIVYSQLNFMIGQPSGVNTNRVLAVKFPVHSKKLMDKVMSFKREVKNITGIESSSISNAIPGMEVAAFASCNRYDDPLNQNRLYEMLTCDYDFAATYGLEIIAGRGFSESHGNEINKMVVNEETVKQLGFTSNDEAIGRKVKVESVNDPMQIIGVAKNYHHQSLAKNFTPIMMIMYNRIGWIPLKYVSVKMDTENISGSMEKIQQTWDRFFPESTFDFYFVDEFYNRQYNQDKRFGSIFGLFSLLAVFVACLGLWALSMFTGILRSKEIGVRRVNGASVTSMVNMLNMEMLKWVVIGIIIALPTSYFLMSNWLQNFAWRVSLSWWIFTISTLITVVIAFFTVSWQTYKAANRNPVESIRYE